MFTIYAARRRTSGSSRRPIASGTAPRRARAGTSEELQLQKSRLSLRLLSLGHRVQSWRAGTSEIIHGRRFSPEEIIQPLKRDH